MQVGRPSTPASIRVATLDSKRNDLLEVPAGEEDVDNDNDRILKNTPPILRRCKSFKFLNDQSFDVKQSEYLGQSRNGIPHGNGTMKYPDGSIYMGQFKEGKKHGPGIMEWPKGNRRDYRGNWEDDLQSGFGRIRYRDGRECMGLWRKGVSIEGTLVRN